MNPLKSLFLIICLSISQFLSAQLSTNDQIWSGGLQLYGTDTRTNFQANSSFQHFLNRRFSIGGQLGISGSSQLGGEQILLAPEIRYYFNPSAKGLNWFASLGSQFEIYSDRELTAGTHFQLKPGFGANINLASDLALESKFSVNFNRIGTNSFFTKPSLSLEASLVHLAKNKGQDATISSLKTAKGNWLIGGGLLRMDYSNIGSVKNLEINVSPSLGYFVLDRLLIGADLAFNYNHLKTDFTLVESNIDSRGLGMSISPFVRYYTAKPQQNIQPYLELRSSLSYHENRLGPNSSNPLTLSRNFSTFIGGGVDIFLNEHTALEAGLNLGKDLTTGQTQLGVQIGLKFFLYKP